MQSCTTKFQVHKGHRHAIYYITESMTPDPSMTACRPCLGTHKAKRLPSTVSDPELQLQQVLLQYLDGTLLQLVNVPVCSDEAAPQEVCRRGGQPQAESPCQLWRVYQKVVRLLWSLQRQLCMACMVRAICRHKLLSVLVPGLQSVLLLLLLQYGSRTCWRLMACHLHCMHWKAPVATPPGCMANARMPCALCSTSRNSTNLHKQVWLCIYEEVWICLIMHQGTCSHGICIA